MTNNEDYHTSTVDGAAGWAEINAEHEQTDFVEDYEDNEYNEDMDECNCSDPGCPCGGVKSGRL